MSEQKLKEDAYMTKTRQGKCPYTKSGKWLDEELTKIIEDTLTSSLPKCPKCKVEGVLHSYSEISWLECPKCGERVGKTHYS